VSTICRPVGCRPVILLPWPHTVYATDRNINYWNTLKTYRIVPYRPCFSTKIILIGDGREQTQRQQRGQANNRRTVLGRDLRSFDIRFEFESSDSDSIRFKSDGLIRKFRISRTCRRTTNHAYCSTKNFNRCAVVIEIYFMFMNTIWYDHYIYNYFTTKHVVG